MNVGIVAQKGNSRASFLAADLRERLSEANVSVHVDEATADALGVEGVPICRLADCDLVVSIGGDGTFLYAASGADGTPILGVNLGEVGFLNAVSPADAVEAVTDTVAEFRAGDVRVREVPRIVAVGDGWESQPAINEVAVVGDHRGHGGGLDVEVRVDGSLYSGGHVDGVLVATPTGSTAYNLSEGGPLVHPSVEGLVVTEMCADRGMPPLVTPLESEVTVTVTGADEAYLASDGRVGDPMEPPLEIRVTTTEPPVKLAGPESNFFEALGKLD
jgi:NAD+ kinase